MKIIPRNGFKIPKGYRRIRLGEKMPFEFKYYCGGIIINGTGNNITRLGEHHFVVS